MQHRQQNPFFRHNQLVNHVCVTTHSGITNAHDIYYLVISQFFF
jgi:hypothetical protein